MKKIASLLAPLFIVTSCASGGGSVTSSEPEESGSNKITCTLLKNYTKESFELSSGFIGKGNCLAFDSFEVEAGELIKEPTETPVRNGYDFLGWFKEADCIHQWDFSVDRPTSSFYLYANWKLSEAESYEEPDYEAPSKIDDSISQLVFLDRVMHFPVNNNVVYLPNSAIKRLELLKDDVSVLLNYRVKTGVNLEATYNVSTKKISVNASKGSENVSLNVTVLNGAGSYVVSNSVYENRANGYENEANLIDDYHVMLAGSSSMENWHSSTEDLKPIVTYNHGIGGTTVEQWSDCLNQRLVYPFNPKLVVYYVGINNVIGSKDSADVIYNKLEVLFTKTHEDMPDTKIMYVLMNSIPGYPSYYNVINNVNARVIAFAEGKDYLKIINPGEALLKENGEPNQAYFLTDGLHLSLYGYVLWGGYIKNEIIEALKK